MAGVINQAEDAVRASVPTLRILYLEPHVHDPEWSADTPEGSKPEKTSA